MQDAQPAEDDFKSSHVWLNVKTEFSFVEQAELVHWHVRQENRDAVMEQKSIFGFGTAAKTGYYQAV